MPIIDHTFVQLVRDMRKAQNAFFESHERSDLSAAKRLERKVDAWLNQNEKEMQALTLWSTGVSDNRYKKG